MIGKAAAAAGPEYGKARRLEQLLRDGAGASGVEGRVLEQPHSLWHTALKDRSDAGLHGLDRGLIGH
jgi:hypothetical protein